MEQNFKHTMRYGTQRAAWLATVAVVALGVSGAALAQQGQPRTAQGNTGQSAAQTQAGNPLAPQIQAVERSLRQAHQQLSQQNAGQGNYEQARRAVSAGEEALGRAPSDMQDQSEFRTARTQLAEARMALEGENVDRQLAALQIREAADALVVLNVRVVAAETGNCGQGNRSGSSNGAQIAVQQPAPQVTVQQPRPEVTVQQPAPQVSVQQPRPEVTVQQPAPQVTVQQARPEVTVQQPRPEVTVQQPRPEVTVQQAEPRVTVQQAQPQVNVQRQGEPQVTVQRQGEPQVNVQRQGEAQVNVERQGEAQVNVQRQGEPQVNVERQGQAQVNVERQGQAQADAERQRQAQTGTQQQQQRDQRTGATTATPAPAQSGGAQRTAVTPAAGVPLQEVSNLIGTNVVGTNGRESGEVENLLLDQQGNVRGALVEWGGFLGIGTRRAVVPMERINITTQPARLEMTREELEALPRYDEANIGTYGRERGWGDSMRLAR